LAQIEDLIPSLKIRGLLPDGPARVIQVQWRGPDAITLTYSDGSGRTGQQLLCRHDQERLELERRTVIGYMARAGVWPLPDMDAIRDRDPADAAVLEAASALSRGEPAHAVEVLRPVRRVSARIARMLANAYEDESAKLCGARCG
jgi:hypothetical protein